MTFTVDFGQQFLKEWKQYTRDQQAHVTSFVALVKAHGLDQTKLPGRLTASWLGAGQADFTYAQQNSLWHYHLGYPTWRDKGPGVPKTSEWVLHLQYIDGGTHMTVLDLYEHYLRNGQFYLPRGPHMVIPPGPTSSPSPPPSSSAP
jgi:hypothetical protein